MKMSKSHSYDSWQVAIRCYTIIKTEDALQDLAAFSSYYMTHIARIISLSAHGAIAIASA